MIFVNVYEFSSTPYGDYIGYNFYSGDSEDSVKRMIIDCVTDSWDNAGDEVVDALEALDTSLSFKEIAWRINDILSDPDVLYEYDLIIGYPTSDISYGLDFYIQYEEDDTEESSFSFYGGYAIKVQNLFPYICDIRRTYNVSISNKVFDKIARELLNL
jgi:hypothetical protein